MLSVAALCSRSRNNGPMPFSFCSWCRGSFYIQSKRCRLDANKPYHGKTRHNNRMVFHLIPTTVNDDYLATMAMVTTVAKGVPLLRMPEAVSELAAAATARLPSHHTLEYRTSLATHLATAEAVAVNSDMALYCNTMHQSSCSQSCFVATNSDTTEETAGTRNAKNVNTS